MRRAGLYPTQKSVDALCKSEFDFLRMNPPRYPPLVQKMLDELHKPDISDQSLVEKIPPSFTREEMERMCKGFDKMLHEQERRAQLWMAACYVLGFVLLLIIVLHFFPPR